MRSFSYAMIRSIWCTFADWEVVLSNITYHEEDDSWRIVLDPTSPTAEHWTFYRDGTRTIDFADGTSVESPRHPRSMKRRR